MKDFVEDILNAPLEQYEELKVIYKDDQATGCYTNSNWDDQDTYDNQATSEAPLITNSSLGERSFVEDSQPCIKSIMIEYNHGSNSLLLDLQLLLFGLK